MLKPCMPPDSAQTYIELFRLRVKSKQTWHYVEWYDILPPAYTLESTQTADTYERAAMRGVK